MDSTDTLRYLCIWFAILGLCQFRFTNGQPDDLTLQLLARVESLEKEGKHQNELIAKLRKDFSLQSVEHMQQKTIIETQQQQLSYQTIRLTEQKTQLGDQSMKLLAQQKHVKQVERTLNQLETKLLGESTSTDQNPKMPWTGYLPKQQNGNSKLAAKEDLFSKAQTNHAEYATNDQKGRAPKEDMRPSRFLAGPVAFQARIDKHQITHIGINQNIVFDVIEMNLGGGYHGQHGVFIAPQHGIYIFSTSILTWKHTAFNVNMMKNGALLGKAAGYSQSVDDDQGSVSVVTQLQTDDEVWVNLEWPENANIRGDGFTSFMGCLIIPL